MYISSWDSNFKVGIQDSLFIKGGIQDSNLNPRKMAGIQDSNLVFKGPYMSCVDFFFNNSDKLQAFSKKH